MRKLKLGVLGSGRGSNFIALAAAVAEGKVAAEFVVVGSDQADAKILEEARRRGIPTVVCPKGKYRTKLEEEIEEGLAEKMVKAGGSGTTGAGGCGDQLRRRWEMEDGG